MYVKTLVKEFIDRVFNPQIEKILRETDNAKILLGLYLEETIKKRLNDVRSLDEVEFTIFSQYGQDGIIAFILNKLGQLISNKYFIEIGVEDYRESNTRYLLMSKNWSGLAIDGDENCIHRFKASYFYWKYDIKALHKFVTRENINQILSENLPKNLDRVGLLTIDIDGNDFYIFDAISVKADILVIEYNSLFGFDRAVVIPYNPNFRRYEINHTGAYFGASIKAIIKLAEQKGYYFLGININGNDAFFIDSKYSDLFRNISPKIFQIKCKFPSMKNRLVYTSEEAIKEIKDLPLVDLEQNTIIRVGDLYGL